MPATTRLSVDLTSKDVSAIDFLVEFFKAPPSGLLSLSERDQVHQYAKSLLSKNTFRAEMI